MRNLRKIFIKKFIRERGGYFGIVGAASMTISALISYYLYSLVNPGFNIISYAVSDLGTGPGLSGLIYNIGLLIASFSQIPLYISLIFYLRKKIGNIFLTRIVALCSLFSIFSHNFLSLVPFERSIILLYYTHGIAAVIHYVAGSFSLILYGYIELLYVKVSKILVIVSFITGVLYGTLWIGYLLDFLVGIPEEYINHTIQWVGLASVIIWSLFHGIFLIKAKKRDLDNIKI
ncbi:MAG: hypothetical protein HWN80_01305 [Candidatus Lokiarchaeota archaeon]|nr:hypothetical protein [Candidatus Lokiarchaeota archaeon]